MAIVVFEAMCDEGVCRCPISLLSLWCDMDDRRNKMTNLVYNVLLPPVPFYLAHTYIKIQTLKTLINN